MMKKVQAMKDRMEVRKAEKKGAASIETIIVAGLLIALAVGIILRFNTTINNNADTANTQIDTAVNSANSRIESDQKE